jgi:hypothetical protein
MKNFFKQPKTFVDVAAPILLVIIASLNFAFTSLKSDAAEEADTSLSTSSKVNMGFRLLMPQNLKRETKIYPWQQSYADTKKCLPETTTNH